MDYILLYYNCDRSLHPLQIPEAGVDVIRPNDLLICSFRNGSQTSNTISYYAKNSVATLNAPVNGGNIKNYIFGTDTYLNGSFEKDEYDFYSIRYEWSRASASDKWIVKLYDASNGVLIADAVTEFVNNTSSMLLEKYPHLELQFGLHANSVKEKLQYIKNVNKAVKIVWEDVGSAPFSYVVNDLEDFDNTVELTKQISTLRGADDKFGVVLKGFTKLDWFTFKHMTGSQCIGVASKQM